MNVKPPKDKARIKRLITLSYLLSTRDEIHIDELCERLEVSASDIRKDVNVLMFCGLPPYSPEQLFDIYIEDDFVSMKFNDVFVSPLRFSNEETFQVLIALSRLTALSASKEETELIQGAIDKINRAKNNPVVVQAPVFEYDDLIRKAISGNIVLTMKYFSMNSGHVTHREILPKSILNSASISYLLAFDSRAQDYRIFRSDRILDLNVAGEPKLEVPSQITESEYDIEFSEDGPAIVKTQTYVDLKISPQADWIIDTIPQEVVDEEQRIYRFYTTSPFFVARLLLNNHGYVQYSAGTITRESVIESIRTISSRMHSTRIA